MDEALRERMACVRLHHVHTALAVLLFASGSGCTVWLIFHTNFWFTSSEWPASTWHEKWRSINPGVSCSAFAQDDCCMHEEGVKGGLHANGYGDDCVLATLENNSTVCTRKVLAKCGGLRVLPCPSLEKRSPAVHEIYHSSFPPCAVFFISGVFLIMRRNRLTLFKADCLYAFTMLYLSMQALLENEILLQLHMVGPARLAMVMTFLDVRLSTILNVLFSAASIVTILRGKFSEVLMGGTNLLVLRELLALFTVLSTSLMLHMKTLSEQRARIELLESINTEEIAHSLLLAMGDAVLHLGPDLRVSKPSETFSALLFRDYKLLEGKLFPDLISPGDIETFKKLVEETSTPSMKRKCDAVAPAPSVKVHLLDSFGGRIMVRIFHRCFLDSTGQMKHLIGIREERAKEEDDDVLPQDRTTKIAVNEAENIETGVDTPIPRALSSSYFNGRSSLAEQKH